MKMGKICKRNWSHDRFIWGLNLGPISEEELYCMAYATIIRNEFYVLPNGIKWFYISRLFAGPFTLFIFQFHILKKGIILNNCLKFIRLRKIMFYSLPLLHYNWWQYSKLLIYSISMKQSAHPPHPPPQISFRFWFFPFFFFCFSIEDSHVV